MSSVLKKEDAEKIVFRHQPKAFRLDASEVAKDFVTMQANIGTDFKIAEVVAQQSGVQALHKQNLDAQVEETVLERLKDIEEQAYRQAHALGVAEGSEKAFEERRADFEDRLQKIDGMLATLDGIKQNILKQNETILMKLVYQIAERIAMREIKGDRTPIVEMLSHLVSEVQAAESIVVKLNPRDLEFVEEMRQKKVKEAEPLERVKLQPTPEVESGGCLVETNFGTIDATVSQRVEKAWTAIESKLPVLNPDGQS